MRDVSLNVPTGELYASRPGGADRIGIIVSGQLVAEGTPAALQKFGRRATQAPVTGWGNVRFTRRLDVPAAGGGRLGAL